jgi:regulator of protease activity HflC (stomatin/prohibitin superfamily)
MNTWRVQKRVGSAALVAAGALGCVSSSFFTVQQSELANVRRWGQPLHKVPLSAGWHFRLPIADRVDRLQVSLTTLHIPGFTVNTVDNQQIELELNFNYTIPPDKVNFLLYNVGKAGGARLDDSVIPVVRDRAGRVFARQNTTTISEKRESIQNEVSKEVFQAVSELFGLAPHSLQFARIGYSAAFRESNENAVKTKNAAVAAENQVAVERAKATQNLIIAQGQAAALVAETEGKAKAMIVMAEAEKSKRELEGQGHGSLLRAEIAAFATNPRASELYNDWLGRKAQNLWNGQAPQVVTGTSFNPAMLVPFEPSKKH